MLTSETSRDSGNVSESRQRPSLRARLAAMDIGDTVSESRPIDTTLSLTEIRENLPSWREDFRKSVGSAVHRAKRATGKDFTVEIEDLYPRKGGLHLIALICRTS